MNAMKCHIYTMLFVLMAARSTVIYVNNINKMNSIETLVLMFNRITNLLHVHTHHHLFILFHHSQSSQFIQSNKTILEPFIGLGFLFHIKQQPKQKKTNLNISRTAFNLTRMYVTTKLCGFQVKPSNS